MVWFNVNSTAITTMFIIFFIISSQSISIWFWSVIFSTQFSILYEEWEYCIAFILEYVNFNVKNYKLIYVTEYCHMSNPVECLYHSSSLNYPHYTFMYHEENNNLCFIYIFCNSYLFDSYFKSDYILF